MARSFNGSTQFLSTTALPVTTVPFTFAAWIKPSASPASFMEILMIGWGASGQQFTLRVNNLHKAEAQQYDGTSNGVAGGTTTINTGTVYHLCGVYTSNSSRAIFTNGTDKQTNSVAVTSIAGNVNHTSVGAGNSTEYFQGDIWEVAIWNAALDDAEVASLAAGVCPRLVRPTSLVAYWPLIGNYSPEIDLVGRNELTLTNAPTASSHGAIIYPTDGTYGFNTTISQALTATAVVATATLSYVRVVFKAFSTVTTTASATLSKLVIAAAKSATTPVAATLTISYQKALTRLKNAVTRTLNFPRSSRRIT